MKLPDDKRDRLKDPKGKLFRNSEKAFNLVKSIQYSELITVGDKVSADFLRRGFKPDVVIVDYTIRRSPAKNGIKQTIDDYEVNEVKVDNPPGHLTEELIGAIKGAKTPVKIIVNGEEDLAAVPAVLNAPEGSVLVYGQPREGIVVVQISRKKKKEFEELLNLFEEE